MNLLFKKKYNYPEFWLQYLSHFKKKFPRLHKDTRFVIFDTETTGLDIEKDRILSIGAVSLLNNQIQVKDSFELYVEQTIFNPKSVAIHGLLKKGELEKVSEKEAIQQFLKYIENSVLVGHHVGFDFNIVNSALKRLGVKKLKNKRIDTGDLFRKSKHSIYHDNLKHYSLDNLCDELKIQKVGRHTASGDALITAFVFQKIISKLKTKKDLKTKNLFY